MLSAGEIKGPTGNVFEDAMKLPEKLADNLRHQSISDLPVVDCEGCPTVRDEYLTNVHEPRFFEYPQGGTYVQYFKPGEYERRKKEAEEVIKNPNATAEAWEKAASILSMFGFPADPKEANALLRRMQSSPDLFTFVDLEISVEITSDGEAKQVTRQKEKPLQIGRSEDGKRVWVFEKNLVLEKPCQGNKPLLFNTLRGVHLTDLDILRLTTLLQAHENDFCVDNGSNGQRTLAVAKDYSVEDIDDRFVPLIAGSKFFAGRAGEIAAALEKSFEKERTQKRLQESQEGAWWKGPLIGVLAGSPIALATLGLFIKMYQMQKKAMEGKADVDVNEFIKDVTEKLKTEKPKIVVVPEVEEIVNKVRAAMDSKHPHIILAGRSGSGKDLIARYLQWLFLNDQIPLRRNKTPKKAGSIDATGMASTGGLFKGMAAKVANALNKVWLGKPGIYHAQEIQNWLTIVESSGYGPGSTSTNAFRMVLHTLETDNPDFTVIGTTSEIEKITAAVNDIERRMGKIIRIPDFSPESLRAILDAITAETLQVYGITLADIDLSSKIIAATKFLEQSPNSGVVNLLDEICREAEQKGQTSVTADDVARMVQEKAAVLNISLSENAARKALDFIEKYPSIEPDRARIAAQLIEYGKNPELVFAQDHELQMALEEGQREMARRSNGGSKKPPGGTPPAAPRGGDGGPSGPAGAGPTGEGQSARPAGDGEHDSNANRTRIVVEPERPRFGEIFEISRGLKGFGLLVAPFIGLDLAEHEGLITPDQKTGFIATLMAGLTYLDRMTPAHLLLLYSPFELGRMGTEAGLEATGVEKGSRTHKVGGTVGAFAAAEGFVMAVGKGAGAQTLKEAHSLGRKVMHDAATTGIRNIATGLNTVFAQAAQIGRQAVQFGRQVVQTARQIAPAGPMMIAPAVAALKGGAVVAAASTAVVAGAVGAAGLGAAYLTYRSGVGEGIADKTSNRWIEKKIYDWFLD